MALVISSKIMGQKLSSLNSLSKLSNSTSMEYAGNSSTYVPVNDHIETNDTIWNEQPESVSEDNYAEAVRVLPVARLETKSLKIKNRFYVKRSHGIGNASNKKRKHYWLLKFNYPRMKNTSVACEGSSQLNTSGQGEVGADPCTCTGYRRTAETAGPSSSPSNSITIPNITENDDSSNLGDESNRLANDADSNPATDPLPGGCVSATATNEPVINLSRFNPEDYPIQDCDEQARIERAREIAEGVDPPPGFTCGPPEVTDSEQPIGCVQDFNIDKLKALFHSALSLSALSQIDVPKSVHTQVDYIHCLVPDLHQITSCSFYWGKMDRYEAERLLESKSEGTFLLRDSAQEEHLFSVSFRKYSRSLHARIEQWNHRFSFDSHDPGVYSANTVCGLIEHYKDPTCCMFFEPLLTIPLHRNFTFSLQHLCRAVICDSLTYDSISFLLLPKSLKTYLKEYHYKQRVRVRKFESDP